MGKLKTFMWSLLAVLFCTLSASAQQVPQLPIDKDVRYGKLENGLTYYVRHNALPEDRVHFYIAQKVGAVQEEDNQRGLAHFLEHMCFNGTKHFPGDRLVKYCESIGVKFGQNLNAYTSTDETVYNIDGVPVSDSNIDSCLYILHDWANALLLETDAINKERGVIHEEWRMTTTGMMRIFNRQLPNMYPGSRYGHRLPIGIMEVVDNFDPQVLRDYYHKWYHTQNQAIIVVGDVDADKMVERIKAIFSPIKAQENPAPYEFYPVPDNEEAIYIVDKDKEVAQSMMQVSFKQEPLPMEMRGTQMEIVYNYLKSIICDVVNARLAELALKENCPFTQASVSYGKYWVSKTKDAFDVGIVPKSGQDKEALQAVMQEIERASRFGLTGTEVFRAKEEFLSRLEKLYTNREKQKHNFYTQQYVRHFLEGNAIPDLETEYQLYKVIAEQLPAEAMSQTFTQMVASTDKNFVVFSAYPEKEGQPIPTVEDLKAAVAAAKAAELTPYVDNVKNEPLVPELPAKGQIVKEAPADFGYTCWTLSNGARVFFKKTDFNESQILMSAQSFGGKGWFDDKDVVNFELMDQVINATGLGNFTNTELQKKLAGKQVACYIGTGNATETLDGSATPKDLRTLFELIYLRFQAPGNDPDTYNTIIAGLRTQLENVEKLPEAAFSDSVSKTIYGNHPRANRIHLADLDKADYETIKRLYAERYNAGGDFDFYFTGALDVDSLRLFAEQYLAPLKAVKKRETYNKKFNMEPVKGVVDNHFVRKMETPQATFIQLWSGPLKYTTKNAAIVSALGSILTERYLKSIREEGGMAYSVGAGGSAGFGTKETYTVQIYCPVKPASKDEALRLVRLDIDKIAAEGVTAEELDKVKKYELKAYNDRQRENSYWEGLIGSKVNWNKDRQKDYEQTIQSLSSKDIQNFVKKVMLKQNNCITVSMLPEDLAE